jgi:ABC-type uncharacterized transport system permease subunit
MCGNRKNPSHQNFGVPSLEEKQTVIVLAFLQSTAGFSAWNWKPALLFGGFSLLRPSLDQLGFSTMGKQMFRFHECMI